MHSLPSEEAGSLPSEEAGSSKTQESLYLDVLAQQPRLNRLYTQLTYCFPLANDTADARSSVISILRDGLRRLHCAFPWIGGCVIQTDAGFKIELGHNGPRLLIKDFHQAASEITWDALHDEGFPYHLLDEDMIAPLPTLISEDKHETALPILLIQANLIMGGLLLTFNAQHGSMDMAGQAEMIRLYAKACRNEQYREEELEVGNMSRQDRIPLLPDAGNSISSEPESEASPYQQPKTRTPPQLPPPIWAYFTFTAKALSSLKKIAMEDLPGGMFVSTDDTLSAFIWQAITRACALRLSSSQTSTTLSRNVDIRRHFSLPPTYPGFATHSTTHTWNIDDLIHSSLGTVAIELRRALDPASLRHGAQQLATQLSRREIAGNSAAKVSELSVRLSSWAKEDCYHHNFGSILGKPEYVRRPQFTDSAREGLVYFLPKSPNGEITVGICLRFDDLPRLRGDHMVTKYSSYLG